MRHCIAFSAIALLAGTAAVAHADPKDDVVAAAKKLNDSSSYSWTTTTSGGMGGGTVSGATQKDGYTTTTFAMRDDTYTGVVQGDKAAVKTADGWKSTEEIMSQDNGGGGGGGGGGGFNPDRFAAMRVRALRTPGDQAVEWSSKLENVQKTDDGYTADLPADFAQQMMAFRGMGGRGGRGGRGGNGGPGGRGGNGGNGGAGGGGPGGPGGAASGPAGGAGGAGGPPGGGPQFSNIKGSVKIWLKDGVITKTETHITGTVTFNGNDRDIDRTTTTEISDLGSAKVDVPDEAKAVLEGKTAAPATAPS